MQYKRDTDYGLRLLLCVAKKDGQQSIGMTINELAKCTAVPSTVASRLCRKLEDARLIKSVGCEKGTVRYRLENNVLDLTLFEAIRALESPSSLFAVFDRSTELYACCGSSFEGIEKQLENALKQITIRELKDRMLPDNCEDCGA